MPNGQDTRFHSGRLVGREYRSMTRGTLAQNQQDGYTHPTGPTTIFGEEGAGMARRLYRQSRRTGANEQDARSLAIRYSIIGARDSSQGAKGYGGR